MIARRYWHVGRESDQVRLRVAKHTDSKTLKKHLAQFTRPQAVVNVDERQGYNRIDRSASRSIMATTNGRAMMMAMAAVRFRSTRRKACGLSTQFLRFRVCIKIYLATMWQCVNTDNERYSLLSCKDFLCSESSTR